MKTTTRTVKATILGAVFIALFSSPTMDKPSRLGENESFYRREYSKLYLEHCRKRYHIIYNDENRDLDGLSVKKNR
jgi:hypothetical protein